MRASQELLIAKTSQSTNSRGVRKGKGKPIGPTSPNHCRAVMVIDGDKVEVGTPTVSKVKVTAEILEADVQADKVTSIRYKAKKRVHTVRGHRQKDGRGARGFGGLQSLSFPRGA